MTYFLKKTILSIMTNNQDQTYLTPEGLKKLEKEQDYLVSVKRKEIAERIQRAKELGDLSENAEYADAKDEQAFTEGRIAEITYLLQKAVVVPKSGKATVINLGCGVKLKTGDGKIKKYTIVGINEADPAQGFISNESPLGQELVGKSAGDKVELETPRGRMKYTVLEIS